jgi:hypothetical protein
MIANELIKEVEHAIKYPEEHRGRDSAELYPLRDQLRELSAELEKRAGEPELMKSEKAERMRQKLEKRLLPKLRTWIPKWGEQLRYLHMDVLKWVQPHASKVILEQEAAEREGTVGNPCDVAAQLQLGAATATLRIS